MPDRHYDLARPFMTKERSEDSSRNWYTPFMFCSELRCEFFAKVAERGVVLDARRRPLNESISGKSPESGFDAVLSHLWPHECAELFDGVAHRPWGNASSRALFESRKPDSKRKKAHRARLSRRADVCELAYRDEHVAALDRCFHPLPAHTRTAAELERSTKESR